MFLTAQMIASDDLRMGKELVMIACGGAWLFGFFVGRLSGRSSRTCFLCGGSTCSKCYPEKRGER